MTVRVFLILPPVRMGFINHDISVFISDKFPILDFFLSPRMIRVKRAHCQKQMDMRIATVSYTHLDVYKRQECFIDVTNYLQLYHLTAKEMAVKLMQAVMEETGITATAGVNRP